MTMRGLALLPLLLAASCGPGSTREAHADLRMFDVAEPTARAEPAPPAMETAAPEASNLAPAAPQIAYTYKIGYRLAAVDVAAVQRAHLALCDSLGPLRCRIDSMTRSADAGEPAAGALSIEVDARLARAFGDRLDREAAGKGGNVVSRGIEASDLSRQMVDTEARIRGKQALTDRLLVLLGNRGGKVGELVEAERAYAQAQEELDAARSWLAQMRGRVAMSKFEIDYAAAAPEADGLWQPVRRSVDQAGRVLGDSVSRLLTLLVAALPWLLFPFLLWVAAKRLGWKGIRLRPRRPMAVDPALAGRD
jgi:hypothetical protein